MTGAAQALGLDRRTADAETGRLRCPGEHGRDIMVLHLDDLAALMTDEELRGVGVSVAVVLLRCRRYSRRRSPQRRKRARHGGSGRAQAGNRACDRRWAERPRAGSVEACRAGHRRRLAMPHPGSCRGCAGAVPSIWHRDARRQLRRDPAGSRSVLRSRPSLGHSARMWGGCVVYVIALHYD